MAKLAIVIIFLVAVTGVGIYLIFFRSPSPAAQNKNEQQITLEGPNALHIADQQPGVSVLILAVVLENGGFVVIYQDRNGEPGDVVGVSPFLPPGRTDNVEVFLARPVQNRETLYAILHQDGASDAQFDSPDQDAPVLNQEGNAVMAQFEIRQ